MKKSRVKKVISIVLAVTMVFTLTSYSAFATVENNQPETQTEPTTEQNPGDDLQANEDALISDIAVTESAKQADGKYKVTISWISAEGVTATMAINEEDYGEVVSPFTPEKTFAKATKLNIVITPYKEGEPQAAVTKEYTIAGESPSGAPEAVKDLRSYPSFESIILKWTNVENATSYEIYRAGKLIKTVAATKKTTMTYKDKSSTVSFCYPTPKKFKYKIKAVNSYGKSAYSNVVEDEMVHSMLIKGKAARTAPLFSTASGTKKCGTLKAGQSFTSLGYSNGRYYWRNSNNKMVFFSRVNVRDDSSCDYVVRDVRPYAKTTAEDFINNKGTSSKTGYLIWASLYTQHVYVFKGKKAGRSWKLIKDFDCASGRPDKPTITGKYYIKKRLKTRHGIKWWNIFVGQYGAIHSMKPGNVLGVRPLSKGCVRVAKANSSWIWHNIPMKTTVLTY